MYRRGAQLDSLQFTLSMATLQSGSTLLSEQELDILTAKCGIIMLTLHEIGCATYAQVTSQLSLTDVAVIKHAGSETATLCLSDTPEQHEFTAGLPYHTRPT